MTNVLLIEDNNILRIMEERHLSEAFPKVDLHLASSGEEALKIAGKIPPRVVVMDCHLEGNRNASDLFDELLNIVPDAVVILATADIPVELRGKRYRERIFQILEKPFETEDLIRVVEQALHRVEKKTSEAISSSDAPKNSGPTAGVTDVPFNRHAMLNVLSGMLAGIRAMEADLEAEADRPDEVRNIVGEYVPRLVDMVMKATDMIKSTQSNVKRG